METFVKILVAVAAVLGVAAVIGLILGGPVWLLWNAILPDLLGYLKAKSETPAPEAKPFVAEGRFDAEPGSFIPAEKKEEQA